uniref:Putative secreted protein n=1 Tax=Ixodes ricinus TaxID=34613 RepID=A0A6B0TR26_IXORI
MKLKKKSNCLPLLLLHETWSGKTLSVNKNSAHSRKNQTQNDHKSGTFKLGHAHISPCIRAIYAKCLCI